MLSFKRDDSAVDEIEKLILERMRTDKVLFFVPGGSAKKIAVQIFKNIQGKIKNINQLKIILTDERFGPPNHSDSNYSSLVNLGINNSKIFPDHYQGSNLKKATENYLAGLKENLNWSTFNLGLFGIGIDGHTAGILPNSVAVKNDNLVIGYQTKEFIRMTITNKVIERLDQVFIYAVGEEKKEVLKKIKNKTGNEVECPAFFLTNNSKLTIFTDQNI